MSETEREDSGFIDETYRVLNERHNNIYQFVMKYYSYIISTHDYGEGIPLTMIEAHTLTYIEENPGVNVTAVARYWKKTTAAVSVSLRRLVELGLIEKRKENGNAKNVCLYPTEKGRRLSKAHKLYDTVDITKTMGELQEECSADEIETFYKVLKVYNKVIEKDFEINSGHRKKGAAKTSDSKAEGPVA